MVCSIDITIHRSRDMGLVKKLGSHPSIYPFIIDDGCSKNPDDWHPIDSENRYYLIPYILDKEEHKPMGILAFYKINHVLFDTHIFLLPQYRNMKTEEICLKCRDWMFKNTPCQKILLFIPSTRQYLINLAQKLNFINEGYCKKSFSLDGKLIDQYIYTLERK